MRKPEELEDLKFAKPAEVLSSLNPFRFPPASFDDAESQSLDLLTQILEIEAQLGERYRCNPDGTPMSEREYDDWRKKASYAKNIKTIQRARLRTWVKQLGRPKISAFANIATEVVDLFESLLRDGVELDEEELMIVESLRAFTH